MDGFKQLVGSSAIVAAMGGIDGPFIGTEALAAGLVTRRGLSSGYDVIYRNVYVSKCHQLTAATRAKASSCTEREVATSIVEQSISSVPLGTMSKSPPSSA